MKLITCTLTLLWSLTTASQALVVVGHDPLQHDRFGSGFPSAPVPNTDPSFVGNGYDLSGIGWSPGNIRQSITMISDEYFVRATHFPAEATINFFSPTLYAANPSNPAAAIVSYAVGNNSYMQGGAISPITGEPGDFMIGKLASPLDPAHGIAYYPILGLNDFSDYIGLPMLVYGHGGTISETPGAQTTNHRLGTNTIDGFAVGDLNGNLVADSILLAYDRDLSPVGEASLEGWDSGGPSFVSWFGRLALVGVHSAINDVDGVFTSYDNFIPVYLDQMETAAIEFEVVPEPSRLMLLMVAFISLGWRRRR
jgi:hypothetical protein